MINTEYLQYLEAHGRSLIERDPPGSKNEWALEKKYISDAVAILAKNNIPIYGGDVLVEVGGKIKYAYLVFGSKYSSLIWSVSRKEGEIDSEYRQRSYQATAEAIRKAEDNLKEYTGRLYFALVIPQSADK